MVDTLGARICFKPRARGAKHETNGGPRIRWTKLGTTVMHNAHYTILHGLYNFTQWQWIQCQWTATTNSNPCTQHEAWDGHSSQSSISTSVVVHGLSKNLRNNTVGHLALNLHTHVNLYPNPKPHNGMMQHGDALLKLAQCQRNNPSKKKCTTLDPKWFCTVSFDLKRLFSLYFIRLFLTCYISSKSNIWHWDRNYIFQCSNKSTVLLYYILFYNIIHDCKSIVFYWIGLRWIVLCQRGPHFSLFWCYLLTVLIYGRYPGDPCLLQTAGQRRKVWSKRWTNKSNGQIVLIMFCHCQINQIHKPFF